MKGDIAETAEGLMKGFLEVFLIFPENMPKHSAVFNPRSLDEFALRALFGTVTIKRTVIHKASSGSAELRLGILMCCSCYLSCNIAIIIFLHNNINTYCFNSWPFAEFNGKEFSFYSTVRLSYPVSHSKRGSLFDSFRSFESLEQSPLATGFCC